MRAKMSHFAMLTLELTRWSRWMRSLRYTSDTGVS